MAGYSKRTERDGRLASSCERRVDLYKNVQLKTLSPDLILHVDETAKVGQLVPLRRVTFSSLEMREKKKKRMMVIW